MVEKGAKNLLIVSRNALSHPEVDSLIQSGKRNHCNVIIRYCNVSDKKSLARVLRDCTDITPPVRGVIKQLCSLM